MFPFLSFLLAYLNLRGIDSGEVLVKELVTKGLPLRVLEAVPVEGVRPQVFTTLLYQRLVAVLVTFELWNVILGSLINEDIRNLRARHLQCDGCALRLFWQHRRGPI